MIRSTRVAPVDYELHYRCLKMVNVASLSALKNKI